MKRLSIFFSMLSVLFFHQIAYCLPAPLSQSELVKQSDIIVKAKVLGTIYVKEEYYLQNTKLPKVRVYQAWLQVLDIDKGNLQKNQTFIVRWTSKPGSLQDGQLLLGPWTVNYIPGQTVKTHLKLDLATGYYKTISWNAVRVIKKTQRDLPINMGDTVFE